MKNKYNDDIMQLYFKSVDGKRDVKLYKRELLNAEKGYKVTLRMVPELINLVID